MTPKHQALFNKLESYVLSSILLEPCAQWLRFDFTSTIGEPSMSITLFNPTFFKFSRSFDDDGHYIVGEAALVPIEDGGQQALTSLGYDLTSDSGKVATYPSRQMFQFRIDGDISVDAVCEAYELLQQVKE
jgi:hypothetical protein